MERITVERADGAFRAVVQSLRDGAWKTVIHICQPCSLPVADGHALRASQDTGCAFYPGLREAA